MSAQDTIKPIAARVATEPPAPVGEPPAPVGEPPAPVGEPCSAPGCERTATAGGMCHKHHQRLYDHGGLRAVDASGVKPSQRRRRR